MRSRDVVFLVGLVCLATMAGVVLMSRDSYALANPLVRGPASSAPAEDPAPGGAGPEPTAAVADGAVAEAAVPATAPPAARRTLDTTGWTTGIVRGDIQLAASIVPRLRSLTVVLEEQRESFHNDGRYDPPHRFVVPVELGRGTPTFEVRNVPFSPHPYVVMVHSPGLNGSRRTVVVDEREPLVDDVLLTITPGAPFSILLRDQDAAPHVGVTVRMAPVGEPLGRPQHQAVSDNFGSVVFADVLAGDYELSAALDGQPIGETDRVTVTPAARVVFGQAQGQNHVMRIPRGVPLQVDVHDGNGYGIAEADVTVQKTDRIRLTSTKLPTDANGRATFSHLQPGTWHVTVEKANFRRVDLTVRVEDAAAPLQRSVVLQRTSW